MILWDSLIIQLIWLVCVHSLTHTKDCLIDLSFPPPLTILFLQRTYKFLRFERVNSLIINNWIGLVRESRSRNCCNKMAHECNSSTLHFIELNSIEIHQHLKWPSTFDDALCRLHCAGRPRTLDDVDVIVVVVVVAVVVIKNTTEQREQREKS